MPLRAFVFLGLILLMVDNATAQPTPQVQALMKLLRDADESTRLKAAKDLGKLGAEAIPALESLNNLAQSDPDDDVRAIAGRAAASIREAAKATTGGGIPSALMTKLKSKQLKDRQVAVQELARMGDVAKPALETMIQYGLFTNSNILRDETCLAIEKIAPTIGKHVTTLAVDPEIRNLFAAAVSLSEIGPDARPTLPLLKRQYKRQANGIEFLPLMLKLAPDDPTLIDEVIDLVAKANDPFPDDRMSSSALRSYGLDHIHLIKTDRSKIAQALTSAVISEQSIRVKVQAINLLGNYQADASKALPLLQKLRFDADQSIRDAAAEAVRKIEASK